MTHTLETLLVRIRDGAAQAGDAELAVELVRSDARLPEELRGLRRILSSDAAGLLAVLEGDTLGGLLAEAIAREGGDPPAVVLDDGWDELAAALREGLAHEARGIDLADEVVGRLGAGGFAWGPVIADAVEDEAGSVDLADDVTAALGIEGLQAFRAEPANDPTFGAARRWGMGLVALAAAALVAVVIGRLATPTGGVDARPLLFAKAGEVVVEDLRYDDDVQVFQIEGEQGAVILWVDEGA